MNAEQILTQRFGKDNVIAMATVENGIPWVRNVNAYYEDGSFYVITHGLSAKMRHIANSPVVSVAGEWFTAHGTGENLGYFGNPENEEIAGKLKKVFAEWINNGHNDFGDINTCVLRIKLTDGVLLYHGTRIEINFTQW